MAKDVIYPGPTVPPEARDRESVHYEAGVVLKPGRITVEDDAWADRLIASGLVADPAAPVAVAPPPIVAEIEFAAAVATEHVESRPRAVRPRPAPEEKE